MKGSFSHVQLNVSGPAAIAFYKDMLTALEFNVALEMDGFLGMSDGTVNVWVSPAPQQPAYNRDAIGLNHLGFHVASVADVDAFVAGFMRSHGVAALFETPRHRPEFRAPPGDYYQVMFTDPDGQLIEVFHSE